MPVRTEKRKATGMGIRDFFKKEEPSGPDVTKDLVLTNMKVGWMVDYDMKTWEVTAYNTYSWGEDDLSHEWQLRCGDDLVYLELESDDEDDWSLNRKVAFSRLGAGIKEHILENDDPPDEIVFDGATYYLEEMGGGHFLKGGQEPGKPLLRWSYEDEEGERYLGIEQWGEDDFEASTGQPVEEYQFENILPRE